MPLVRFDAVIGRTPKEVQRLLDAAHRALLTAFEVPPRDRYQIYCEHPAYCEALMLPYMPKENQLVALQFRLARAAYAFLDAELQSGKTTPEAAKRLLTQEVAVSDAYAASLLRRFTYLAPSQATSYFYGYTRMMQLRQETEAALGAKFQVRAFHDFVLGQGLLPTAGLRQAVKTGLLDMVLHP